MPCGQTELICTPFYWTSSERGIFMRYSYEFKRKAVELYRQGKWIEPPADITNLKNFHDMIVKWHHLEEVTSPDCCIGILS